MINLHISVQAAESGGGKRKNRLSLSWPNGVWTFEDVNGKQYITIRKAFTYTFNMIDYVNSLLVNCYQNGNVLLLKETHKTSNWLLQLAVVKGSTVCVHWRMLTLFRPIFGRVLESPRITEKGDLINGLGALERSVLSLLRRQCLPVEWKCPTKFQIFAHQFPCCCCCWYTLKLF